MTSVTSSSKGNYLAATSVEAGVSISGQGYIYISSTGILKVIVVNTVLIIILIGGAIWSKYGDLGQGQQPGILGYYEAITMDGTGQYIVVAWKSVGNTPGIIQFSASYGNIQISFLDYCLISIYFIRGKICSTGFDLAYRELVFIL